MFYVNKNLAETCSLCLNKAKILPSQGFLVICVNQAKCLGRWLIPPYCKFYLLPSQDELKQVVRSGKVH